MIDDPRLQRDAEGLTQVLVQLTRVVQLRDRDRICRCAPELTVSQCYGLTAVVEAGSLSVNDLAAELLLDKSTVSRLVNQLREKDLITKAPNPADRRAVLLEPTQSGRRMANSVRLAMVGENAAILREFDPEVRSEMLRLADRLLSGLAQGIQVDAGCCTVTPSSTTDAPPLLVPLSAPHARL